MKSNQTTSGVHMLEKNIASVFKAISISRQYDDTWKHKMRFVEDICEQNVGT